ncbi:MAG: hypothetical protein HZC26_02150 [Candidatus Magasanikbacteria bacterium]|nr:hypothetical protein [Candidatus Magasanikbacteria bacterium]
MKHIHFIGICGVAMSALALAFKKAGWQVTGSDVGIYPPISDYLKKNKVDYYTGWHPEKMSPSASSGQRPDLVVVGNVAGSTNPEWLYTQEHKLEYKSYPELIAEYFVKKNSIVCAGTYGKTTTAALLSWILTQAGMEPNYMFGGLTVDVEFPSAMLPPHPRPLLGQEREYSVLEGDEYKSSRWDNRPKFAHYSPTHLLLTAVEWDHADVYPTEESYFAAFENLVKSVPKNGTIVMNESVSLNIEHGPWNKPTIKTYGKSGSADYRYYDVKQNNDGIEFKIAMCAPCSMIHDPSYVLRANTLGNYMAENITGAFAMACEIGIKPEIIIKAISEFKGLKRRLEKRFEGEITVFDDIAHSPAKAQSALETLRKIYLGKIPRSARNDKHRVIAIFEPNTGNRQPEAIPNYDNKFSAADLVIIPGLTRIKHDQKKSPPLEGEELAKIISKTHSNVK